MKAIILTVVGAVALFMAAANRSFAIEGLQIAVQSSNVVLSWPSTNTETYIVQYRRTLDPTNSWTTLTNYYPAATDTNVTFFIHSNIVQYPSGMGGDTNGGGGISPPGSMLEMAGSATASQSSIPLIKPANGSGLAVPLSIYPPGFDLSDYLIFNPTTKAWVNGAEYSADENQEAQPMDDSGGTNSAPDTGFYRVVRDGMHIFGLTNGMVLSGEMKFPIEMALDSTDEIAGITFYADGAPLIGASVEHEDGGGWTLDWDTLLTFNGTYDINAEVDFDTDDAVTNLPVSVTVNNVISFPNYFSRIFGSQMWIYAQTIPDAPYQIEMYDENTNDLGYFSGYADDSGYISFIWDLTDGNGNTFASTNFTGVFTVFTNTTEMQENLQTTGTNAPVFHPAGGVQPLDSGSSANTKQNWAQEGGWSGIGNFAVAYSPLDDNATTTEKINDMVAEGVVNILWGTYTLSGGNNPLADQAEEMVDANSKATLLGYLAGGNYRNFYFFGHGNAYAFGWKGAIIDYHDITRTLNNFFMTKKPINYHPYRLVFIDGCDAGKGALCEAFGIPAQTVDDQFFVDVGVRSRAFLSFTKDISFNPNQWQFESDMLANFWNNWVIQRLNLQTCVSNAQNFGTGAMDKSAVIYGSADLQINSP